MGVPSDHIPPPKPEIFFPTLPGKQIVLYKNKTDLAGSAEPGSTVNLFKNGLSLGKTNAEEEDVIQSFSIGENWYGGSLSPDGRR